VLQWNQFFEQFASRTRRRSARGVVAASVTLLLSVLPVMSIGVGFAQQQSASLFATTRHNQR